MSLRDFLWDYPVNLKKLYLNLIPLSHILFFTLVSFLFYFFIFNSDTFKSLLLTSKSTFVEGVVGSRENLNPLFLNSNQVDRDLQELIFTKFVSLDSQGYVKQGLAKSWSVSPDSKSYTFIIRDDMYWQDGKKVTADDVEFTFNFSKELYSKYSANTFGQGLSTLNVAKTGQYTVKFTLSEVNATIFEMLSVYIVPKHILENSNVQTYAFTRFSELPIGNGPYRIIKGDTTGIELVKNQYYPEKVGINEIKFKFYSTNKELESAFRANQIDGFGVYNLSDVAFISQYSDFEINRYDLPFRKKILFFNTRNTKFANSSIRKGMGYLLNKQNLLSELNIDGVISNGSIPTTSWAYQSNLSYLTYSPTNAALELKTAGYTKNPTNGFYTSADGKILSLTLTYLENEFNTKLVEKIVSMYEKEGVLITGIPKNFDQITRETLASRDFDMILYEVEVSVDPDQYNLWHSLKIDYPNLNISGFKQNRLDVYLERGRQLIARSARLENYVNFQKLILNESPALFLYEPKYFYIIRKDIQGFTGTTLKYPQERFERVTKWEFK